MTKALEEAFAAASWLPPEKQDDLAAVILEELETDARWEASFSKSQDALSRLAGEALAEHRAGLTAEFLAAATEITDDAPIS